MNNELLLLFNMLVIYGGVLVSYLLFSNQGLVAWIVVVSIAANLEVLILIEAFGMEQTMGNMLFASSFLVTDILSETAGKKQANRAVYIGIFTTVWFIILSQFWLWITPAETDWVSPMFDRIFSSSPRVMMVGLLVYGMAQQFDVWIYHGLWNWTKKTTHSTQALLWVRNNGSTLISQLLNSILFTFGAFFGVYEFKVLLSIVLSSYIIFVVTSVLDTPILYIVRWIHHRRMQGTITR